MVINIFPILLAIDVAFVDQAMSTFVLDSNPNKPSSTHSFLEIEHYIPVSYKDDTSCPGAELWRAAIHNEYDSLMVNKTWTIQPLPLRRKHCSL